MLHPVIMPPVAPLKYAGFGPSSRIYAFTSHILAGVVLVCCVVISTLLCHTFLCELGSIRQMSLKDLASQKRYTKLEIVSTRRLRLLRSVGPGALSCLHCLKGTHTQSSNGSSFLRCFLLAKRTYLHSKVRCKD